MGFLVALIGFAMLIVGLFGSLFGLPLAAQVGVGAGGALFLGVGGVMTYMSFYKRTAADMAFVNGD